MWSPDESARNRDWLHSMAWRLPRDHEDLIHALSPGKTLGSDEDSQEALAKLQGRPARHAAPRGLL